MRTATILFSVPHAGGPAMPGGIGVLAIAIEGFARNLVLLVDLQGANKGASVTNSVEACLEYVRQRLDLEWPGTDFTQTDFVQLDSLGWFDRVNIRWNSTGGAGGQPTPIVCWEPLRGAVSQPRTLRAFIEVFDDMARIALEQVQRYVDEHHLSLRVNQESDDRVASD
jgi:hypothetical protein